MAVGQKFDRNPLLGGVTAEGGLCFSINPPQGLTALSRPGRRLTLFNLCGSMLPLAHSSADYFETNGLPATL